MSVGQLLLLLLLFYVTRSGLVKRLYIVETSAAKVAVCRAIMSRLLLWLRLMLNLGSVALIDHHLLAATSIT